MSTKLGTKPCYVFFEALATKLKIDILTLLSGSPKCVNEISAQMREERSKVSHALASLLACGFIKVKQQGKKRVYYLNKKTAVPLLRLVSKHVKDYCHTCKCRIGYCR